MNKTPAHAQETKHQAQNGTREAALARVRVAAHRLNQEVDRQMKDRPRFMLAAAAGVGFAVGTLFASRVAQVGVALMTGYLTRDLIKGSGMAEELKRLVLSVTGSAEDRS